MGIFEKISFKGKKFDYDPTQVSQMPPGKIVNSKEVKDVDTTRISERGRFNEYKPPIELTDETGRSFYEITKNGINQLLTSRLLKGIINISDVTYKQEDGKVKYYSYKMPLQDIEVSATKEQIKSDFFIFKYVFSDSDRFFPDGNMNYDRKIKRLGFATPVYFDFEYSEIAKQGYSVEYRKVARECDRRYLMKKLFELRHRFQGEEGVKFVTKILESLPETVSRTYSRGLSFDNPNKSEVAQKLTEHLLERVNFIIKCLTTKPTREEVRQYKRWRGYVDSKTY